MRIYSLLFLPVLAFTLGCKPLYESADGSLPAEYLEITSQYVGSYEGRFHGTKGVVNLSLNGASPVITFIVDGKESSFLPRCEAQVGTLKSVALIGQKGQEKVRFVSFHFHPGQCGYIQGRDLNIDFRHTKDGQPTGFIATVYVNRDVGGCSPHQGGCDSDFNYLTGTFKKQ